MKKDYTYCLTKDCIHKIGCKRWIGNYSDDKVKDLYTESRFVDEVDESYCKNSIPYPYECLDRFRNSDGSKS